MKKKTKKYILGILFSIIVITLSISFVSAEWTDNLDDSLVSYYRFSEGTGTNTKDMVSGYDGVGNSIWNLTDSINDYSMTFTGSQHINVTDPIIIDTMEKMTVSAWIKKDSDGVIWAKYDLNTANGHALRVDSGKLSGTIAINGNNYLVSGNAVLGTDWTMVTMTYDGEIAKLYVNGTYDANNTNPSGDLADTSAYDSHFGARWVGEGYQFFTLFYDGEIDELSFWERNLSDSEILQLYNEGNGISPPIYNWTIDLNTGLEYYYPFNESSGTTSEEVVFGINNMTIPVLWDEGLIGSGIEANVTHMDTPINFNNFESLTLNWWQNISSYYNYGGTADWIMMYADSGADPNTNGEWRVYTGTSTITFNIQDSVGQKTGSFPLNNNSKFEMITLRLNSSSAEIKINNVIEMQLNLTNFSFIDRTLDFFSFGGSSEGSRLYNTTFDEMGVWNTTLSNNQITQLYNYGNGISYMFIEEEEDTTFPIIHLISPFDNFNSTNINQTFSANITDETAISNLTLYIWNSSGSEILGTDGIYVNLSFDTAGSGNADPFSIVEYDGYFWITDYVDEKVYKYNLDGTYADFSFNLITENNNSKGIVEYDNFFWIADWNADKVFKYYTNGTYTNFSFDLVDTSPSGMTIYNNSFWIVDVNVQKVYQYYTNGTYTGNYFNVTGIIPYGLEYYEDYFWIVDNNGVEVYQYYTNGSYTGSHFDISGSGNTEPFDLTISNGYFWIIDRDEDEVYQYSKGTKFLTGIFNETFWNIPFSNYGTYTWNVYGCDTSGNCAWSLEGNYTFEYLSIAIDTSFTISLPSGTLAVNFEPLNKSHKEVVASNQTAEIGIFQITNTGNIAQNFSLKLDSEPPAWVVTFADDSSTFTDGIILNSTFQRVTTLNINNSTYVWLWANFTNADKGTESTNVTITTNETA
jgi:hypothetical protein